MREDVEARATAVLAAPHNSLLAALMNEEFYLPEPPLTLADAGLSESLVDSLVCKYLLAKGNASGRAIANHLCLPFCILEPRLQALRTRSLVTHSSAATLNDYVYVLTEKGTQQAQNWMEACAYVGAAPVPLMQ